MTDRYAKAREFIADQTADPAFAQHLEAARKHADDRPATTDQEPKVYGATPDRPEVTTDPATVPPGVIDDLVDALDYVIQTSRHDVGRFVAARHIIAAPCEAAPRASQGHQEPASVPGGQGAAQGATDGSAAESEPRYIVETNHCGQWLHGLEFDDLTEARDYAEYCHATYGGARIVRVTREVIT